MIESGFAYLAAAYSEAPGLGIDSIEGVVWD
jgi:hypothetical protein